MDKALCNKLISICEKNNIKIFTVEERKIKSQFDGLISCNPIEYHVYTDKGYMRAVESENSIRLYGDKGNTKFEEFTEEV